ncbi:MAG TPA: heme-binding domain-containing protein [Planctomycetaceae bacterium]|nr:heme-binding domain-containing protein [Planctomycetaceae bacterium]
MRSAPILLALIFASITCPVVNAQSATAKTKVVSDKPIRALLVTGGCCHDYDLQKLIIPRGVSARADVIWTVVHQGGAGTAAEIPLYRDPNWADGFDVVVHNECFADDKDPAWCERILKPHKEGKPAVLIHCSMHSYRIGTDAWFEFCGLQSPGHGPHYAFTVDNKAPHHPIMKGFGDSWTVPAGELYFTPRLFPTATPLGTANRRPDGEPQTCIWTNDYRGTRVFATTIGHYNQTMADAKYLDMLTRGLLWAVHGEAAPEIRQNTETADKELMELIARGATGSNKNVGQCCREGNLALGKPVEATSEETGRGNIAKHATDGDLQTRWCANGPQSPESLLIDLQTPQNIGWLRVHWESANNAYRYKIEASEDKQTWAVCVDASANDKPGQVVKHQVDLKSVRYLRITYLGSSAGGWGSLWEIEASETELPELTNAGGRSATSVADVKAPDGFQVSIFAGPPEVNYPVCITTAPSGEVFVGVDQQGSLGKEPGGGRIVRCIDSDGDGTADRVNTFAMVDHPRGMVFDNNRLWVLHPPSLSLFIDHDKDGISDEQQTLITGISTDQVSQRGADHTTNGIRMGIDGWIYIAVGDFGFNNARGADGRVLSKRGGGVVRVRPDGTDMEIYSWGLRNILDVCIDPQLNMFTRDNTNDGGGWNVRFSHLHQGGDYGYPSRYMNFASETLPPMADYGGGSGCGAMYHFDPRWPVGFESAVLTCDWGTSKVYRHRPSMLGPTFSADQDDFLSLPRPTDIDVDASGRMFVSSWKNGNFSYTGPDVGFVAMIQPADFVIKPLPDLADLSAEELVQRMRGAGAASMFHLQQELLRRPADDVRNPLTTLAHDTTAELNCRIASIFTIKQSIGADANPMLAELARAESPIQEFAIRALTDRANEMRGVSLEHLVAALKSSNQRVQLQATISAGRLAQHADLSSADRQWLTRELLPMTVVRYADGSIRNEAIKHDQGDPLRVLSVLAVQSIIQLKSVPDIADAIDGELKAGAMMALRQMHSKDVVDTVLQRLSKAYDQKDRIQWIEVLARLHDREGDYTKGDWWGTRPDTRGPYYDRQPWEQSERISRVLIQAYASSSGEARAGFDNLFEKYQIKLGDKQPAMSPLQVSDKAIEIIKADPNNPNQIGNRDLQTVAIDAIKHPGNAEAGKLLFASQSCIACHTYADGQTPQGPHLVDIGKRYSRKELVESVLEPGAKIAQGFDSWAVLTTDGTVQVGFVVLESAETITLRGADGRPIEILQDEIEERRKQEQSMMPKGLVDNLTAQQLADLIAFIESLN